MIERVCRQNEELDEARHFHRQAQERNSFQVTRYISFQISAPECWLIMPAIKRFLPLFYGNKGNIKNAGMP
jgi:hypothetical protein